MLDELAGHELPRDDLVDEAELTGLGYEGADLSGRDVASAVVRRSRFRGCTLGPGTFGRVSLVDCELQGCDLANLQARSSSLTRVAVTGCRLTGLSWAGGWCRDVRWDSCRADLVSFRFTRFLAAAFVECDLRQADFQEADLSGITFTDCDLSGAQFSGATTTGTRFSGCTLIGISGVQSLRGAVVDSRDIVDLGYSLACALGILVEE